MIGYLPQALEVGGKMLPIHTDFRKVIGLFPMFNDPELSGIEKAYVCVRVLYKCKISEQDFDEAVEKAYWFIDGGGMPTSEPEKARIIDWEKDERMIMPAVSKTVGVPDVRSLPYLHYWTFLGAFGEIGEGLLSTVLNIRRKLADGETLEKWERDYVHKNRDLIEILTPEEEADLKELNDFLDTIT